MSIVIDAFFREVLALLAALSGFCPHGGEPGHYISAVELGDRLVCITPGGGAVVLVGPEGGADTVFSTWAEGFESLSPMSAGGHRVSFTARGASADFVIVIRGGEPALTRMGPWAEAGNPSLDQAGRVWFCADGCLRRDGEPLTGVDGAPFTAVSPSGGMVALMDPDGSLEIMDTGTLESAPAPLPVSVAGAEWAGEDELVSWSADGTIWVTTADSSRLLARGEQPSWSRDAFGVYFTRTRDDGHRITSSSLYFTMLDGPEYELDTPDGSVPVNPSATRMGAVAVDAATGELIRVVLYR